ncbi:MAG: hypothetical protein H0V18_15275 [Pyrinomonadaceae bacterium]|nr:hypothetical protein [Pyrinomonadaceae bacterium]
MPTLSIRLDRDVRVLVGGRDGDDFLDDDPVAKPLWRVLVRRDELCEHPLAYVLLDRLRALLGFCQRGALIGANFAVDVMSQSSAGTL